MIPDYPQPGIRFKDITTLLKDGPVYKAAINELKTFADTLNVDVIAGPEARGFVVGAPLSYAMNVGFIPIRKANKLPYKAIQADYSLEYGSDALAMHEDAIKPGDRVLIADDLLATGGTIETSINLVEQLGGIVVGAVFLIELSYLDGREKLGDIPVSSLITY
ncbi:adenine phosphoribosyltransferase [Brevibacillus laterosporus GI-9]|nr:adenine phosphoribosyltransferase [Brevibacillus laterosporus GI-9]